MSGNNSGHRSKVEIQFDIIHNTNVVTRHAQEIVPSPPTYEEVSSILSHREFPAGQRAQNINSSEINQILNDSNNSSSNLLNMPLSQNESDVSIPDLRGSQSFSHMGSINEEER
ncbi:3574_t:CDS:2 [Diversispora eburnea]|uniref:3574_t:CDS:1 n=1 Tax=Diversispora eburnea TaxID=1213867 RepID=A0A9N9C7B2_9GLOM|nr:3574_t:CDS:2 [Diversispora eburnea]